MNKIKTTKARIYDVEPILALIRKNSVKGIMLARSKDEILQNLRDYFVARHNNQVIGVCSLHIYTDRLSEIKALSVADEYQHQGIATRLVRRCLKEAKDLGLTRVFALTYAVNFFEKLNFKLSDKNNLPEKIWKECSVCAKKDNCDEICLEYTLRTENEKRK